MQLDKVTSTNVALVSLQGTTKNYFKGCTFKKVSTNCFHRPLPNQLVLGGVETLPLMPWKKGGRDSESSWINLGHTDEKKHHQL